MKKKVFMFLMAVVMLLSVTGTAFASVSISVPLDTPEDIHSDIPSGTQDEGDIQPYAGY